MEATVDYASAHLALLLQKVTGGEEVLLRQGGHAVAKIVPVEFAGGVKRNRPLVGELTSPPIKHAPDAFTALDEQGMRDLGML